MSRTCRPRIEHELWSTPLHAGEREAASTDATGLLSLEDTGNYRATCRRCRDEVPERLGKQPAPELVKYVVAYRQRRVCPDKPYWFQSEAGCCYRVDTDAFEEAVHANDIAGAVSLFHICGLDDSLVVLKSAQMVQALHAAGADLTPYIVELLFWCEHLRAVEAALKCVDVNITDVFAGTLMHVAVATSDIMRVQLVLARDPDMTALDCEDRTPLQLAQDEVTRCTIAGLCFVQIQQQEELLQRAARYSSNINRQ